MPETNKTNNIQVGGDVSLDKGVSDLLSAQKQANPMQDKLAQGPVTAMQDTAKLAKGVDPLKVAEGMDTANLAQGPVTAMQDTANLAQGPVTAMQDKLKSVNPANLAKDKANAMIPDKLLKGQVNDLKGQLKAMKSAMNPNKFLQDQLEAMKSKYALQALKIPASILQVIGIGFLFALASFANGIVYYSTSVINIPENTLAEILQGEANCIGLGIDETECNTRIKCFLKKCGIFDRPKKKKKEDPSVQMGGYSLSKNSKRW